MTRLLRISLLTAAIFSAAFVFAQPAKAKPPAQNWNEVQTSFMPERKEPRWVQRKISYAEAKAIALRSYPGAEVRDIALRGNIYYVRLDRDGRVFDVRVDAVTGRVR